MDPGDILRLSYTEAENVGYCKPHKIPGMSVESCATRKNAKPPPASCIKCEGLIKGDVKPEEWGQDGIGQGMKKIKEEDKVAEESKNGTGRRCPKCERMESECKGVFSKKSGLCNRCYQKWLKKKLPLDEFLGKVAEEPLTDEGPEKGEGDVGSKELQCPNCQKLESERSQPFNLDSGLCDACYRKWAKRGKPPLEDFIADNSVVNSDMVEESQESVNDRLKMAEDAARRAATNSKFSRSAMTSHNTIISVTEVHGGGLLFQGIKEEGDGLAMRNFVVGPEAAQLLVDMVIDWRNGKQ